MKTKEFVLEYKVNEDKNNGLPVVIVAAGNSGRMKGTDKIFAQLKGIPLIVRTMSAFQKSPFVSEIVVVTKSEAVSDISLLAKRYMITKLSCVTEGGEDRLSSVQKGISMLKNEGKVLIHDGARPFVSEELIKNVVLKAQKEDCVVPALSIKDTVKRIEKESVSTIERTSLVAVQTPQCLNLPLYRELLEKEEDKSIFTDDASVMEKAGVKIALVDGQENNIKITTPFDLKVALAILEERL